MVGSIFTEYLVWLGIMRDACFRKVTLEFICGLLVWE
jgi:hypothetical protein